MLFDISKCKQIQFHSTCIWPIWTSKHQQLHNVLCCNVTTNGLLFFCTLCSLWWSCQRTSAQHYQMSQAGTFTDVLITVTFPYRQNIRLLAILKKNPNYISYCNIKLKIQHVFHITYPFFFFPLAFTEVEEWGGAAGGGLPPLNVIIQQRPHLLLILLVHQISFRLYERGWKNCPDRFVQVN